MGYAKLGRVFLVAVVTALLALVACGEGNKEVEPAVGPALERSTEVINGFTYDSEGARLFETLVEWHCATCDTFIGGDYTDRYGAYHIYTDLNLSGHNGHTFEGVATKDGYYPDTQHIYNFIWSNIPYSVDFTLVHVR
jgi:hypothetical protein